MVKTFLLKDINEEDWEEFKNKIPRKKTINQALIELIKRESKGR